MSKLGFLRCVLLLIFSAAASAARPERAFSVCEVTGQGTELTYAVIEYDTDIDPSGFAPDGFAVSGREIEDVYLSMPDHYGHKTDSGSQLVLKLKALDQPGAARPGAALIPDPVEIIQRKSLRFADGSKLDGSETPVTAPVRDIINADAFEQYAFADPDSDAKLRYNLFEPRFLDDKRKYPLVVFLHDEGINGNPDTRAPLLSSNGATVWADISFQGAHSCFVLAPVFEQAAPDGGNNGAAAESGALLRLLDRLLQEKGNIDPDKIYLTGQGTGSLAACALMQLRPDFFAAALLVSARWDGAIPAQPVSHSMWLINTSADEEAAPGTRGALELWQENGAVLNQDAWPFALGLAEHSDRVRAMLGRGGSINYSLLLSGRDDKACYKAYGISALREWLFAQRRHPVAPVSGG